MYTTKLKKLSILIIIAMLFLIPQKAYAANLHDQYYTSSGTNSGGDIIELFNTEGDLSPLELKTATLNENEIPEFLSVDLLKSNNSVKRLNKQEKDMSSVLYQNTDGSKTLYLFSENVKYKNSNGEIKDKSTTLKKVNDCYIMDENDIILTLPDSLIDGVNVMSEDFDICFYPLISNDTVLQENVDNTIKYYGVFDESTNINYTPLLSGVKEEIILDHYTGKNTFEFVVETNGQRLVTNDNGTIDVINADAAIVAQFSNIFVYDSNGEYTYGDYEIISLNDGQLYQLNLIIDDSFLSSSQTQYPVVIDPTLFSYYNSYKNILDGCLSSASGCNYGGINSINTIGYTTNYFVLRMLIKLPGLYESSIFNYNSVAITSANLHLYSSSTSGNAPINVNVYAYTGGNWAETNLDNTVYSYSSYNTSYSNNVNMTGGYLTTINILNFVQGWKSGTISANNGLIFIYNTNNFKQYANVCSTENANNKPIVSITYTLTETDGIYDNVPYRIINKSTSKAIDVSSTNLVIQGTEDHYDNSQFFQFEADYTYSSFYGWYFIKSNSNPNKYLTCSSTGDHLVTSVTVTSTPGDNQRWYIVKVSDGIYQFVPLLYFSKSLSTLGNTATGSQLGCNASNTNDSNKWLLKIDLGVPEYKQIVHNACGCACVRMISAYNGIYLTEDDIIDYANSIAGSHDYTYVHVVKSTLNHFLSINNINDTYSYSQVAANNQQAYLNKIVSNLSIGKPIIVQLSINDTNYPYFNYTANHYVVISGIYYNYSQSKYYLLISDPHYDTNNPTFLEVPLEAIYAYNIAHSRYIISVQ